MNHRRIWLASLALLLFSSPARAQSDPTVERARSHVKAAIAYYDEARYEDAAREMETAYRLKPLADLQYNLAQCYERLNRLPDAVSAYRRYLDGKPGAEDRDEIVRRVKNLEERLARELAGAKEAAPAPPPVEKIVLKTVVVYREAPAPPGRSARYAAYGVAVVALGALASGIAFAVLARRDADAVTSGGNLLMPVSFDGQSAQTQEAGHQDRILSGVSFGIAGAAAVGAVGLYFLGNRIDKDAARLAVAPMFGPTGGGIALAGSF